MTALSSSGQSPERDRETERQRDRETEREREREREREGEREMTFESAVKQWSKSCHVMCV